MVITIVQVVRFASLSGLKVIFHNLLPKGRNYCICQHSSTLAFSFLLQASL